MHDGFFKDKKIFITGHTGFKGTWLCRLLINAGASLTGYALAPPSIPQAAFSTAAGKAAETSFFAISGVEGQMNSIIGDIRNIGSLCKSLELSGADIVIHMAAQPLVRDSYENPVYTYETNVMGTANILECIRKTGQVKYFLNITTDKVYENSENTPCQEADTLDGFDPYSNSKSCSELVTKTWQRCFFSSGGPGVATARAGNVIGGGDYAKDRIVPDSVLAALNGDTIQVRNPHSIRPYQHVLEPLMAYLHIIRHFYTQGPGMNSFNIGPGDESCVTTARLVDAFCKAWGNECGWQNAHKPGAPREADFLKLNCKHAKQVLGWQPKWGIDTAIEKTVEVYKAISLNANARGCMEAQINEYCQLN